MLKKLLLIFIFIHFFLSSKSQITFQIVYGDTRHDEARSTVKSGNGYVMIGSSGNPGIDSSKIFFEKLDSAGNIILSSDFYIHNLKNTYGNAIQATPGGGLIICGTTFGSNIDPVSDDALLIRTDEFGNVSWAFVYGGVGRSDGGLSVDVCTDGGFLVAGTTIDGTGTRSGFAMKVDATGNPAWYNANTILNNSRFNKGSVTTDGGFVATGSTVYASSQDLFVVKYDSSGNVKWSKRSAAAGNQVGNSIRGTSDGGCIIAGSNSANGSVNATDMLVVKLDSSGNTQWSNTYNSVYEDDATDILELSNGHFIISCYINSTDLIAPVRSIGFLELNSSGIPSGGSFYGSNTFDNLSNAIVQTNDGGFLIAGVTYEYDIKGDAVLIKTDSSGGTHTCSIHPVSFTGSVLSLTDSSGSNVTSVLPDYSSITLVQDLFTTSFSPICFDLSVSEQINQEDVNLFPNPAHDELRVRLSSGHAFKTLLISDIFGRVIAKQNISSNELSIQLDPEIFNPGIYFIELQGEKNLVVKKFVKVD